ncbi:hypothetical protein HK104_005507, partial [Borealophlyctis nickersoniae]
MKDEIDKTESVPIQTLPPDIKVVPFNFDFDVDPHGPLPKRLMRFSPSNDVPTVVLTDTLSDSDRISAQKYFTISHVWGNVQRIDVKIPGVHWKVPVTGMDKLKQIFAMRERVGAEWVWLDILCMDQDSPEDVSAQVNLMGQVYSLGSGCLVLTEEEPPTDQFVEEACAFYVGPHKTQFMVQLKIWHMVQKSTWLTRVWTFQEMILPRRVIIFGKNDSFIVDLDVIATQVGDAAAKSGSGESDYAITAAHALVNLEILEVLLEPRRRKDVVAVRNMFHDLQSRQCSRPEDLVYGGLGLVKWGRNVKVDYGIGVNGAWERLLRAAADAGDWTWLHFYGESLGRPGGGCIPNLETAFNGMFKGMSSAEWRSLAVDMKDDGRIILRGALLAQVSAHTQIEIIRKQEESDKMQSIDVLTPLEHAISTIGGDAESVSTLIWSRNLILNPAYQKWLWLRQLLGNTDTTASPLDFFDLPFSHFEGMDKDTFVAIAEAKMMATYCAIHAFKTLPLVTTPDKKTYVAACRLDFPGGGIGSEFAVCGMVSPADAQLIQDGKALALVYAVGKSTGIV